MDYCHIWSQSDWAAMKLSPEKGLNLVDMLQRLYTKENSCKIFIANGKRFYDCGIDILISEVFLDQSL